MNVLYVEDNPSDADLTRRALSKSAPHIHMDVAGSQAEALAKLARPDFSRYDLVLIDRQLPDGDGLSLLAQVRARSLPVATVMVTGSGDEELVIAALKAGADDYIVKRGDYLDRLALTLEAALEQSRQLAVQHNRPLQVLYAEHNSSDVDLTRRYLDTHAPHIHLTIVDDAEAVIRELTSVPTRRNYDLLLMDYRLPGSNALELLKELRQGLGIRIPVILVTGQGDEDIALQALKLGAADYLPKTGDYLGRLPLVLEDAYHRFELAREQAALKASEARYRSLFMDSPVPMFEEDFSTVKRRLQTLAEEGITDFRGYLSQRPDLVKELMRSVKLLQINKTAQRLYGLNDTEVQPETLDDILHPDSWVDFVEELSLLAEGHTHFTSESENTLRNGRRIYVHLHWMALPEYEQSLEHVIVAVEDLTQRKHSADRIQQQLLRLNALRAIDEAISSNLDLRVTLRVLLDQVIAQLDVDAAAVLLYHPETQALEYVAQRGFMLNFPKTSLLRLGQGYGGQVALSYKSLSIFDLDRDAPNLPENLTYLHSGMRSERFKTCIALPLVTKGDLQGVLEVYLRAAHVNDPEWTQFLETLAGQAAIAVDNARLFDELQRSNSELVLAYDATIEGWTRALDLRDKETEGHTLRVVDLTMRLCAAAGISRDDLVHIRRGALLHDIGKMGVPDAILHKPGPLDEHEWEIMRRHPLYAYEMLAPIAYLRPAIDIPYCHHEKWDGSGYPRGLKGEQIPLAARIFAVVDVWDALRSDRPYRPAWSEKKALAYLKEQSGRHFDPRMVDLLLGELELED